MRYARVYTLKGGHRCYARDALRGRPYIQNAKQPALWPTSVLNSRRGAVLNSRRGAVLNSLRCGRGDANCCGAGGEAKSIIVVAAVIPACMYACICI